VDAGLDGGSRLPASAAETVGIGVGSNGVASSLTTESLPGLDRGPRSEVADIPDVEAVIRMHSLRPAGLRTVEGHGRIVAAPIEGDCGGISALPREPMMFLEGRVALLVPHVPGRILGSVRHSNGWTEVMWVATAAVTLEIELSETMRRETPLALVREVAPSSTRLERAGDRLAAALPMRAVAEDDEVLLADAFAVADDGFAVRLRITTDPIGVSRGGCRSIARTMVAGLTPTGARLVRHARTVRFAGLAFDLPFAHTVTVEPGADFDVLRVIEVGATHTTAWLGIYDGYFPHRFGNQPPVFEREMLGERVRFFDEEQDGTHQRECILDFHDNTFRHVFYGARDEADFARMEAIVASIRAADVRSRQ
jgi:hypothetical protein